jgi:U3 small nucleolar RNA-associated protein MPP10
MENLHSLLTSLRAEDFAMASPALAARLREGLRLSFGLGASVSPHSPPLRELLLAGFDSEQLWAQLSMQHGALLRPLGDAVAALEREAVGAAAAERPAPAGGAESRGERRRRLMEMDAPETDSEEVAGEEEEEEEEEEENDEVGDGGDSEGSAGANGDLEAFLDEGDAAMDELRNPAKKKGGKKRNSDSDDDSDEDFDVNAPVPDSSGDEAPVRAAVSKAERLRALKAWGPRYEDLWGPKSGGGAGGWKAREWRGAGKKRGEKEEEEGDESSDDEEEEQPEFERGQSGGGTDDEEEAFIDGGLGGGGWGGSDDEDDEDGDKNEEEGEEEDGEEEEGVGEEGDGEEEGNDGVEEDGEEWGEGEGTGAGDPSERRRGGNGAAPLAQGWDEGDDGGPPAATAPRERVRAKLAAQVAALEAEALAPKPWTMRGEVAGKDRPQNSLLSAEVDAPQAAKLAPPVTEHATVALEDMIRQRIADGAFDDPVRKLGAPPDAAAAAGASAAAAAAGGVGLSVDKPAQGLGEEYAEVYGTGALGRAAPAAERTARVEAEVRTLMEKLHAKLDALCNFHFVPAPSVRGGEPPPPSALPALALEEATPAAASAAALVAPREAYAGGGRGRGGVLKSAGEKTGAERAADRRAKKATKRAEEARRKAEARAVDAAAPGLGNPYAKKRLLEELRGGGGGGGGGEGKRKRQKGVAPPARGGGGGGSHSGAAASAQDAGLLSGSSASAHTSSAQFFGKLQEEAAARIAGGKVAAGGAGGGAERPNAAVRFKL